MFFLSSVLITNNLKGFIYTPVYYRPNPFGLCSKNGSSRIVREITLLLHFEMCERFVSVHFKYKSQLHTNTRHNRR